MGNCTCSKVEEESENPYRIDIEAILADINRQRSNEVTSTVSDEYDDESDYDIIAPIRFLNHHVTFGTGRANATSDVHIDESDLVSIRQRMIIDLIEGASIFEDFFDNESNAVTPNNISFERQSIVSRLEHIYNQDEMCPICVYDYDVTHHLPRILPCGHTICDYCIKKIARKLKFTFLECPLDRKLHRIKLQDTENPRLYVQQPSISSVDSEGAESIPISNMDFLPLEGHDAVQGFEGHDVFEYFEGHGAVEDFERHDAVEDFERHDAVEDFEGHGVFEDFEGNNTVKVFEGHDAIEEFADTESDSGDREYNILNTHQLSVFPNNDIVNTHYQDERLIQRTYVNYEQRTEQDSDSMDEVLNNECNRANFGSDLLMAGELKQQHETITDHTRIWMNTHVNSDKTGAVSDSPESDTEESTVTMSKNTKRHDIYDDERSIRSFEWVDPDYSD